MDGPSPVLALASLVVISGIASKVVVPVGVAAAAAADMVVVEIWSVLSVSVIEESALSGGNVGSPDLVPGSEIDT